MGKMGRPIAGIAPRNKTMNIRISDDELKRIRSVCEKHDITYMDVVIKGIECFEKQDKQK